jgi:predicted kinase
MNENLLILTVGIPRSGKSTWAREQNLPVVNPDSIRLALHGQRFQSLSEPFVWAIATVMVRALFLAGHSKIIVDATHTTKKRREFWKDKQWRYVFKVFDTSKEICLKRAEGDAEMIPVIERMHSQYEPLTPDEGELYAP